MKETLGDYVEIILGGTPKTADEEYWGGDISFITPGDIGDTKHITSTARTITESGLHNSNTKLLDVGDVVISARGTVGKVMECDRPMAFNQSCYAIRTLDKNVCHPKYLFYLIKTCIKYLQQHASGSVFKAIIMSTLARVPVDLPSMNHQQSIASTLSAYDDLIENNRRRIQLLEQVARLLYKEWFVHIRFPGHEHVTITDGVPEGWERKPFSELATFMNGFAFKPSHWGDIGMPIVKIPELRDGPTAKTPRNIGEHIPEKYLLDNGDILFSWSGSLLVNIWNHGKGILNQHLFKVSPVRDNLYGLVYFALKQALVEFQNQTTGATMKHIRRSALEKVAPLIPTAVLLLEFESVVHPKLVQISNLQKQITEAKKARDLLLPRLMNGELVV